MESNPDYKFVRLCGSSPKDVIDVPIFNNYKGESCGCFAPFIKIYQYD
jgi:hypothetical protein